MVKIYKIVELIALILVGCAALTYLAMGHTLNSLLAIFLMYVIDKISTKYELWKRDQIKS